MTSDWPAVKIQRPLARPRTELHLDNRALATPGSPVTGLAPLRSAAMAPDASPPAGPPPPGRPADLAIGAFTDDAPWEVDPDSMTWRRDVDRLRQRTQAEVPELTRRRKIPPGGRVVRVGSLLVTAIGSWYLLERRKGGTTSRQGLSHRLRNAFERLGPTYIKLGQIISSGEGIFPEELVQEFRTLRDKVKPESFETVQSIIEADLGRPLDRVFSHIDRRPRAAASIAQVHDARLVTGEAVVVKVQRPQVASLVRRDLAAMSWIAPALVGRIPVSALANPPALVELFAETIVEELDFRLEAQNMLDIAKILADTDQRSLVVPRPHPTLVTRRILVMERLDGFSFDDVAGMKAAGIDTTAVVRASMVAFLEGAMLFGVFHGDLHGGNLFVRQDGTVALLDYGITGRLSEQKRLAFLRLLIGGTVNDIKGQLAAFRDLGALPPDTDLDAVIRDLDLEGPVQDPTQMTADELTAQIRDIVKKLLAYGARMPKELMLFVKDMLFLDGALATLAPDVDLFAEITHVAEYFATQHGARIAADIGVDVRQMEVDLAGMKASMGLTEDTQSLTYRDLQKRRETIRKRMEEHQRERRRAGRRG